MKNYLHFLLFCILTSTATAFAQDTPGVNAGDPAQLQNSSSASDMQTEPPPAKTQKPSQRPKIGFKNTVKPDITNKPDITKSYNRPESGDISAQ